MNDPSRPDLSPASPSSSWPVRPLGPLADVPAGPCAWRATMLATPSSAAHVRAHPSLVVVEADDDEQTLSAVAAELPAEIPIALRLEEPDFIRRFEDAIRQRIAQLGRERVAVVLVDIAEPAELKGGGLLQCLFHLRERKIIGHVGLATEDVLAAEWMSQHTAVRALMFPYAHDQLAADYRLLPLTRELGQACIASNVTSDDGDALAFALGASQEVLPVRDSPLPANWRMMSPQDIQTHRQAYQATHQPPPPLPRSRPPE